MKSKHTTISTSYRSSKNSCFIIMALIAIAILTTGSSSVQAQYIEWQKTFGNEVASESGRCVIQTSDGGYVIVGSTTDKTSDCYIVKTNADGDSLWTRTFGSIGLDNARSVVETGGGDYVVAGTYFSIATGSDMFLTMYDSDGKHIWTETYDYSTIDLGYAVDLTSDGGYVLVGTAITKDNGYDVFLVKTDSEGIEEWSCVLGGVGDQWGYSIQERSEGGYVITGSTFAEGESPSDVLWMLVDEKGNLELQKSYDRKYNDAGYSVQQAPDGGYIIAGYSDLGDGSSTEDAYIIRVDKDGEIIWQHTYGGLYQDRARSIDWSMDGNWIVTGFTEIESDLYPDHMYLFKINDSNGDTLWTRTYVGSSNDRGYSVVQTTDGSYIVTGSTESYDGGNGDVWLVKICREFARTLRVPSEYATINDALNARIAGDTILVAPGTYKGEGNRNIKIYSYDDDRWFVLKSEAGPEQTIIDIEGSADSNPQYGIMLDFYDNNLNILIDGFTFRNGYDVYGDDQGNGAGIKLYNASPTIRNCIFENNTGGAIHVSSYSSPAIENCAFIGNASNAGGGIRLSYVSPTILNCTFENNNNSAIFASGGAPIIDACTFTGNSSNIGGGINFDYSGNPQLSNCLFDGNTATESGGAIMCSYNVQITLTNSTFIGNTATESGGAILCSEDVQLTLNNSTFVGNSAAVSGSIYFEGPGEMAAGNQPKSIGFSADATAGGEIENCIFAFGTEGEAIYLEPGAWIEIMCCNIFGNAGGDWVGRIADYQDIDGNLWRDPLFCDTAAGDYTLTANSPCLADSTECGQMGVFDAGCDAMQIAVSPEQLSFIADVGTNPSSQTLTIDNPGGATLNWIVRQSQYVEWLSFSQVNGTAPITVTVSASAAGLAVGTYRDTLIISSTNAVLPDTSYVPVNLIVKNPTPIAAFTGLPDSGDAPLTVEFSNSSSGFFTTSTWDFGDGEISDEKNPVHVYTVSGLYTVSLTVDGQYGSNTETKEGYVTVSPVADFVGTPTEVEPGDTIEFTDLSTEGITSWYWDFGDDGSSELQNPSHMYDSTGSYTVSLTVEGPGGSDTETKSEYISVIEENLPPEFTTICNDVTLMERDPFSCQIAAIDPNDSPISFSWNGSLPGAMLTDHGDGTAEFSFIPDYNHVDSHYTIIYHVSDGQLSVSDTMMLDVINCQLIADRPTSENTDVLITDKPLLILFNEAVQESTLVDNVIVTSARGDNLTSVYEYDPDLAQLIIDNGSDYWHSIDTIVVTLSADIFDLAGYRIDKEYTETFVTGTAVYPGDANNDGVVDERDVLPIGLFWGNTGPLREGSPDLTWELTPAHIFVGHEEGQEWSPAVGVYADADGNGTIGSDDICGVTNNWLESQPISGDVRNNMVDMSLAFAQLEGKVLDAIYESLKGCSDCEGKRILMKALESQAGSNQQETSLPTSVELYQNYPNPFNPYTTIGFYLPHSGHVTLSVFNIQGRKVTTLLDGPVESGYVEAVWDGIDQSGHPVASGVYFYRLEGDEITMTKRMMLIK